MQDVGTARGQTGAHMEAHSPPPLWSITRKDGVLRILVAILLPFICFTIQYVLWPVTKPFAWFLFYPALFFSSWIGGTQAGVAATIISALLIWWSFVPPGHTLAKEEARYVLSAVVFVAMGILFSLFHGRLRRATQQLSEALAAARLAGEKLQDANEQINRLIEEASDGIFLADLDGRYVDVNSAGCLMLGYSREEIVGKFISDLIPPADADRLRQSKEELLQGGIQIADWDLRRKDGAYLPVEVSAKILPDGRWQALVRDITERKRAESETRMLARLQSVVADLGLRALRPESPGQVFDEAVALVAHALDVEYCKVLELQPDGKDLLLRSGVGWREGLVGRATVGAGTDSQAGYTLLSDEPVIVEDLRTEKRFSGPPLLHDHGVVSGISVVIPTSTGPYGVLGVHTRGHRTFTADEVHFLQATANVLGSMIERYRTEEALRESEANLNRAQEVAHIGSWYLDFVHKRRTWSNEVFRILGVPKGTPRSYEVFLGAVHPDDLEYVNRAWTNALHGSPYDIEHRILVAGELRWVRAIAQVEFDANGNPLRGIGTLQDITRRKLVQARLMQISRANRALSKCNQVLIRAEEESTLLQQICEIVVQEAEYRLCWVGRAEQDDAKTVRVLAQAGWGADYLDAVNITWANTERGRGPTGTCIRKRQTTIAADIASNAQMEPWRAEALKRGFASSIAIPLLIDAEVFGALTIYAGERDAFHAEEVELLTELASDLAFGIATLRTRAERAKAEEELRTLNAELEQRVAARTAELAKAREREFEVGCRIQQSLLLDQPPADVPGLRIAALSIPTQRIDGDFYIFIKHREGALDVIVGDVMGKGIPAALLGAATKAHFLKALSHLMALSTTGKPPEPQEIVTLTHAEIVRHLVALESFVTLCYARLDVKQRRLDLVDCGHTGIVHLHGRTGLSEVVHGNNLPLGVREGEIYEQVSVPCEPRDMLLFFSDGITEARNPAGELFGAERLQEYVRTHGQLEPQALVDAIRQAIVVFSGSDRLNDDLTSVAIRLEEVETPLARAEITIRSDLRQLRQAREFVRSFCGRLPLARLDEGVSALELAVNEAVSNIMKHAYHGRSDQWIEIEGEAFSGQVSIRLHHVGDPFDPATAPLPALNGSRDSGFGLYILTRTVDEVHYGRDEHGRNCVVLVKRWKSHGSNESETSWK